MPNRLWIVAVVTLMLAIPATGRAGDTKSGVQWTPDSARLLVNKDVGNERWSITLNLSDFSATGNVFFTDGSPPAFIWCQKTGQTFDSGVGELDLSYACYGADPGFGGFASSDWTLISSDVVLPLSFFIPAAETCDLTDALNGSNANNTSNYWNCGGSAGPFQFQVFSNGTAFSTATGDFDYDAVAEACRIARLDDKSFLDLEYSPSRDHLTIYETTTSVDQLIVSECERLDF